MFDHHIVYFKLNITAKRGIDLREHDPWVGEKFESGINGQRVMIVGWSHWGDESEDVGTIGVIERVISGEWRINFFTQIRGYFGFQNDDCFWQRVMFINYLPNIVGGEEQRYGHGTMEQREIGQKRFLRLIREKRPHKVLVFTSRRWAFPKFDVSENLGPMFPQFSKCKYKIGAHEADIFFLRHPQGASKEIMTKAVRYILELPF
jgi:hypothetical protein